MPLTQVVQPHLDLLGLGVTGQWIVAPGGDGAPRHRATIGPRPDEADLD